MVLSAPKWLFPGKLNWTLPLVLLFLFFVTLALSFISHLAKITRGECNVINSEKKEMDRVIDARKVIESIAEITVNISVSFRAHNDELIAKIKRDSRLLEQKIKEIRNKQYRECIEAARQNLDKLAAAVESKVTGGILFSEMAVKELNFLFSGLIDYTIHVHDYLLTGNKVLQQHIKKEAEKHAQFARDAATKHEERLIQGICQNRSSAVYLDMLYGISGIFYNLSRLAE